MEEEQSMSEIVVFSYKEMRLLSCLQISLSVKISSQKKFNNNKQNI
jgi:hypothetical protein